MKKIISLVMVCVLLLSACSKSYDTEALDEYNFFLEKYADDAVEKYLTIAGMDYYVSEDGVIGEESSFSVTTSDQENFDIKGSPIGFSDDEFFAKYSADDGSIEIYGLEEDGTKIEITSSDDLNTTKLIDDDFTTTYNQDGIDTYLVTYNESEDQEITIYLDPLLEVEDIKIKDGGVDTTDSYATEQIISDGTLDDIVESSIVVHGLGLVVSDSVGIAIDDYFSKKDTVDALELPTSEDLQTVFDTCDVELVEEDNEENNVPGYYCINEETNNRFFVNLDGSEMWYDLDGEQVNVVLDDIYDTYVEETEIEE